MAKGSHPILLCSAIAIWSAVGGCNAVLGQTNLGTFSSPDTTAFLSVDINGGPESAPTGSNSASPTEGWNQQYPSSDPNATPPAFGPDPYGVTWSPWGGPTNTYGDGVQLPSNEGGLSVGAVSISKTFAGLPSANVASGSVTVAVNAAGTPSQYSTSYAQGLPLNSRDRGLGWTGGPTGPAFDIDMWRDFIFAAGNGSNVQSTDYLQLEFSGLNPNSTYVVSMYAYDGFGSKHQAFTATPPLMPGYVNNGWWQDETANPGNQTFQAPADEQVMSWSASGTPSAPAVFEVITNGQGQVDLWTWGGTGTSGDQNADTSYLNGFQISGGTAVMLGDTNGDGIVNGADLATLETNLGNSFAGIYSRGYAIGDFNGDGVVNRDDFGLFQLGLAEYDAGHLALPEPAGFAMVLLASSALIRRSRQRSSKGVL